MFLVLKLLNFFQEMVRRLARDSIERSFMDRINPKEGFLRQNNMSSKSEFQE